MDRKVSTDMLFKNLLRVARRMLDRRNLVQAPNAPRDQSQHPRACNDYDEETAYESYMNPFWLY